MSIKWIRRRAHMRRLPSGQMVEVASSWMPIERSIATECCVGFVCLPRLRCADPQPAHAQWRLGPL